MTQEREKYISALQRFGSFRDVMRKAEENLIWGPVRSFNGRNVLSPFRDLLFFIGSNLPIFLVGVCFISLVLLFFSVRKVTPGFFRSVSFYIILLSILLEALAVLFAFLRLQYGLLAGVSGATSLSKVRWSLSRANSFPLHYVADGFGLVFHADHISVYFLFLVLLVF